MYAQQKVVDSLLNVIKAYPKEDSTKAGLLVELSMDYQASNLKAAESTALQALDIAEKINDNNSRCAGLSQLGSVYSWERLTTKALDAYFHEKELAEKMKNEYWLQDAYLGIGYVYELENDWNKAISYTLKAVPIAETSGDPFEKAFAYNHLGSQYLGLKDNTKAEFYLRKAGDIFKQNDNWDQYGDCELNLGKVFTVRRNYDSAKLHFEIAIKTFLNIDEPYQVADVCQAVGDMYVQMGLYEKAAEYYERTIQNYKENDIAEADYALARMGLGVVALSEKKYDTAYAIFHNEFIKLKAAKIIDQQLNYLKYMAKVDSALGRYQEALDHMQSYASLYDSFYNEEKSKAAQRMVIEFEVQQKDKENEQLKIQNNLQKQQVTIFAVMGIILLITGIFLASLYRQKTAALRSLKDLQRATETKNRELAVINAIKDKLISMIAHDVRAPLTSLQNTLYVTREKIINEDEFMRLSQMLDNDIRHLVSMLDNTLLWAREQIHVLNVDKEPFNLHHLVNDVIGLYNQSIIDKQLAVHNLVPQDLQVTSDREIMHAVLRNMVSNAIKFTPPQKNITISTEIQPDQVLVHIKDEGTGIAYGILEKISKKEFISTRGTNNEKGTGLGLMFSYDLLAKLNESLTIKTEPGEGTTVIFSISPPAGSSA